MAKTLLVGLDAACWPYLNPLLEQGRMPVLQQLIEGGAWGTLASTMPPWTPTAWATLATGKNPGKHGIYDMLWRRPDAHEFTPTSGSARQGTPFWTRLNQAGLRTGLVNVPFTYPPTPLDGFMVAGFGTPESARDLIYPAASLRRVEARFGPYKPVVDARLLQRGRPAEVMAAEKAHQAQLVEIAIDLADHHQVDVLVINLMLTDHANHKMPTMAEVQEAYVYTDADLGQLLDGFQPDQVMLISDHGSSRLKGDFLLHLWLRDHGYLTFARRNPREQDNALNWLLMQWLRKDKGWNGVAEGSVRRALRFLLPRLPDFLARPIWSRLEQALPFAYEHVFYENRPDYECSAVFPGSVYAGLLYLNHGEENDAWLAPELEIEALIARLRQIKTPDTGRPLFRDIYYGADLYEGPAAAHAPDLVLDAYDGAWNVRTTRYTPALGVWQRDGYFVAAGSGGDYGWHSRDGIFVFHGSAFSAGPAELHASLSDVPATLLYLHGVPIPDDFDGDVLTSLLAGQASQRPLCHQPGDGELEPADEETLAAGELAQLTEHLKALGYLE